MLHATFAEENFLQVESLCQISRNKKVRETHGPIENELSKVHETEVHVFSDSVVCLGKSAMNMPEIKFTERWKEHLEYYKDTAKRIDGKHIQFIFHILPGAKTNETVLKIDEWIRQGQGEDGQRFFSRNSPSHRKLMQSVFFFGVNQLAYAFTVLAQGGINSLSSDSFRPGCFFF